MSGNEPEQSASQEWGDGLTAWAAYVVGHHPNMVALWLDEVEDAAAGDFPPSPKVSCKRVRRVFGRLNWALRRLALSRTRAAAALVEFHRQADAVRGLCLRGPGALRASGKNDCLAREQLLGDWGTVFGHRRSTRHETVGHRRLVGTAPTVAAVPAP